MLLRHCDRNPNSLMTTPDSTLYTDDAMLTGHLANVRWGRLMRSMAEWMQAAGVSASRTVVLVPYAQLMSPARQAWARFQPTGFAPRFESSRNWAEGLMPFAPGPMDWSGDTARDSLVASALVDRVARSRSDLAMRSALTARLLEATRSLVPRAAAVAPECS